MGVGRLAPHRARARYVKALKEIPLPMRSFSGIDPNLLTVLGEFEIDDRRLEVGIFYAIPRLWIAVRECVPSVLGFVDGMETGLPELHVTEPDHLEWARRAGRGSRIECEAMAVWDAAQRDCEG